ncbi:hypothetical protein SNK05_013606 [Fusarium graminearum]
MGLWTLFTDRMVKWGKAEEEERLTGRAETRRTLFEWFEVMLSTIAYAIMFMALFLITLTIVLRAVDAAVIPPGKLHLVDDGKYRIHVYCHGNKTDSRGNELPTVLFEGDEWTVERDFWSFADIAINNGTISRYCFVDRPGYGWSDTSPSPSSAGFVADAVSEALAQAGERGQWVLASAGIGSLYSRVFSSHNGDRVKGLLLIDPLHEDLLDQVGAPGRGFLLWLHGVVPHQAWIDYQELFFWDKRAGMACTDDQRTKKASSFFQTAGEYRGEIVDTTRCEEQSTGPG